MSDPFPTTNWTAIRALQDTPNEGHRLAFAHLYRRYWPPLFAYLRHRGHEPDAASDMLQAFFVHLLDREVAAGLELTGKLRAYLLAALKNFERDQWHRDRAQKRHPGTPLLSLDAEGAEARLRNLSGSELTPDQVYERQWAADMVHRTLERLRHTEIRAERGRAFDLLKPHLLGDEDATPYAELAAAEGVTTSAIKVRVHRLRERFRRFLEEDIEFTVAPHDVASEANHILGVHRSPE